MLVFAQTWRGIHIHPALLGLAHALARKHFPLDPDNRRRTQPQPVFAARNSIACTAHFPADRRCSQPLSQQGFQPVIILFRP